MFRTTRSGRRGPGAVGPVVLAVLLTGPPAAADDTASPTASADAVPPAVIQNAWQQTWNTVQVRVRSDARHWTLRSCPTAQDPGGSTIHAQGTQPSQVSVAVVESFDWSLMDRSEPVTFCAEAVSDDGAGHTGPPTRTTVDLQITPGVRAVIDRYAPLTFVPHPAAGNWNQARFQVSRQSSYGKWYEDERVIPGVPLEVRRRQVPGGPWIWMGQFTTDSNGMIAVGYRHDKHTEVQVCRPDTRCATVLDSQLYGTMATVSSSAPTTARRNRTFPVYASVLPRYAGRSVHLCENQGHQDCRLRSIKRTDSHGRVVFSVPAGSVRTSRSFRVWSPTADDILGKNWDKAPIHNVRLR
ncbi:MAG: hypothetical protein QG608_938 [Actinomycetota bacterium]|nr:hypothetical protein [Actinomycetota bacterium]